MQETQNPPAPPARTPIRTALWAVLIAAIFLLSVLAFFQWRVSAYDDGILLMGARLVQGGRLPYVDFYTHYGPLGYTLVAAWSRVGRNPGLALRGLQAVCFGAILLLLFAMGDKKTRSSPGILGLGGVAFGAFVLSNVFRSGAFLGFAFGFASLVMVVLSRAATSAAASRLAAAAGGIFLVLAGLVRPAFAAYAGVAIAAVEIAAMGGAGKSRNPTRRVVVFAATALVALAVIWIVLYRSIPPSAAFQSTILGPSRLVGGGERFISPRFLLSPAGTGLAALGAILAGGLIAAASACWIIPARSSATRALAVQIGVVGGLGTAWLERGSNPGSKASLLAGILLLMTLVAVFRMRREIAESVPIAAGALFGVTATAFGHYFWTRADREHLAPALALAAIAAGVAWPGLDTIKRVIVAAVFGTLVLFFPRLPERVVSQTAKGEPLWTLPWPAGTVPQDAVEAVRFADRNSDPRSRFVAVASTHGVTSASPVLLFLLSSRRPYTKWYQYDPGLQSSPAVQEEMTRELTRSDSRAAIVWNVELYIFEPRLADLKRRTRFDEAFDRLYPIRAARFGEFEVRFRSEEPGR